MLKIASCLVFFWKSILDAPTSLFFSNTLKIKLNKIKVNDNFHSSTEEFLKN